MYRRGTTFHAAMVAFVELGVAIGATRCIPVILI